jgi:hypothetical protein
MVATFFFSDNFKDSISCSERPYAHVKVVCIPFRCSHWRAARCSRHAHGSSSRNVRQAFNTYTETVGFCRH